MTPDEQNASALVAACATEASVYILAYARDAGLDPPSFRVSVAAVRASSALAAQPEDPLSAASRYIQNALELMHGLREREDATGRPHEGFAASAAIP